MRRRAFMLNGPGPTLLGPACLLAALGGTASAQNAPAPGNEPLQEVVVTGFRASLQSSTDAKKEATGFTDSIFAEDIGKFPDTNIAESFNRIPGITITREISGEGLNITIRGLGTNFTKVLLNGAPVAIASTGRTDSTNTNREVDLDLFPTELFTQLSVHKSSAAHMLEGGAAGTVDMRSARPFDQGGGQRLTFSLQGTNNTVADDWGGRASVLASKTWDTFGVLVGAAGVRNKVRTTGFETIGWTNPNLSAAQCTPASAATPCNNTGGGNWTIPGTVPANAGNGLTTGATIDQAFLLARNPGLTIQQLDNALIPRLGRPSDEFGDKDRYNGVVSLEYKPSENLHFYVDSMYGKKKNDLERIDMNWVGRFGAMVPLNVEVDRADCSKGCVVKKGTYANAQFFLEYRPFIEDTDFWGVNPGFDWKFTDELSLDVQANKTHSKFHRESPTFLVITPGSSGITVDLDNTGTIPVITPTGVDLNNPNAFAWQGGRVNMQDERRETETKGARFNLTWSHWSAANLHFGGAYDDVSRRITAYDNTQAWQNAACGGNPSIFLPAPNGQPPCEGRASATPGLVTPAGTYPAYPGLGTGYTAGQSNTYTYGGSLVPLSQLSSFLMPGPDGFITADWKRFKEASQYDRFHSETPEVGSANTGAVGGFVREKSYGAYVELSGDVMMDDHRLRYTAGLRRVRTDQTITGRIAATDPRNFVQNPTTGVTSQLPDGARYPSIPTYITEEQTYYNTLPSLEVAFNVTDQAVVRGALSKTMTRADPNAMLPGASFSDPSAVTATVGNPTLGPYESENVDLGFEYYTGGEGYVGIAAFRKRVTGFTITELTNHTLADLAQYGIVFDTLSDQQKRAICPPVGLCAGNPASWPVLFQRQINSTSALTVNGLEFNWVQPLDFALGRLGLNGFGISANLTVIDQRGTGASFASSTSTPAVALGVAPHTYNGTVYYDNNIVSARLSGTFAKGSQTQVTNQNGIPDAALFSDDYKQWDFSSSLTLSKLFSWQTEVQATFDVINLFESKQRSYFQFEDAAFTQYNPGRQYLVGIRGRF
jgi:TonB-dependent receptor